MSYDKKEKIDESGWILGWLILIFGVLITVAAFLFVISLVVGLWKFMWYVIGL